MTTTTAAAGAPAGAADGKAASSTATTATPDTRTGSQRMTDTLKASRKAPEGKRSPADAANPTDGAQPPADAGVKKAGDALPEGDKAKADQADAEKGKKEPETIPMKAFKARLGEVTEKVRLRTEERDAANLRASRAEAAVKLLSEEFEALRASIKSGKLPDERDEQLRQHDLERRAREANEQIARGAEEAKSKATEEERRAEVKARVDRGIAAACAKHDLVEPDRLRAELARVWKTNARASIEAIAAKLQEDLFQRVKVRLVPPTPTAPSTVQSTSDGSTVHYPDNAEGMKARLKARRAVGA
jgi:hypothetical protein